MTITRSVSPLSRRKRFFFFLISYVFIALLLCAVAEIGARIKGFRPYAVKTADIVVVPGGRFFTANPTLGYTHLPGQFKVTLGGSYTFTATNLSNTLRVTHPLNTYPPGDKREIWVFGDSVTYGWSVNDEEGYPWLLQQRFPDYEIVNFGVSGYGNLHSLVQLREALTSGRKPLVAILAYASWDDVRNTNIRFRRKMLTSTAYLGPLNQPGAKLSSDGKLSIFVDPIAYREFPLMRYSAFMHFLEETYDRYEERHANSHEVTKTIISEFSDLCRSNGIELVVVSLTSDPTTSEMLAYCQRKGIKTRSIWVDLNIKENNNLPYDSHPSATAHRQYAEKLGPFLRSYVLKDLSAAK